MQDQIDLELFDAESSTKEDVLVVPKEQEEEDPNIPEYASPEWNKYVMEHFRTDELIDGNPICAGLRRVAGLLLGELIESGPDQVFGFLRKLPMYGMVTQMIYFVLILLLLLVLVRKDALYVKL